MNDDGPIRMTDEEFVALQAEINASKRAVREYLDRVVEAQKIKVDAQPTPETDPK